MAKFRDFLQNINFPMIAFVCYITKMMVFQPDYADSLVILAISGLFGYTLYLKSKKPDPIRISDELKKQIDETNRKIADIHMRNNIKAPNKFKF